ncbi:MAG: hypothetical protein ACJ741_09910 [Pyrinomonadaceae bacterium]
MDIRGITLRVAAFFVTFVTALSLTAFFMIARVRNVRPVLAPPARAFSLSRDLDTDVQLVSLDRENRRSYTRLSLWLRFYRAPERLWVRTYFFTPDDPARRVWSSAPVELRQPFADGSAMTLNVAADCEWCGNANAPRSGFFARVQVSTDSESSSLPEYDQFFDIRTAAPVVVQFEPHARP